MHDLMQMRNDPPQIVRISLPSPAGVFLDAGPVVNFDGFGLPQRIMIDSHSPSAVRTTGVSHPAPREPCPELAHYDFWLQRTNRSQSGYSGNDRTCRWLAPVAVDNLTLS